MSGSNAVTVKFADADIARLKKAAGRAPVAAYVRALVLRALEEGNVDVDPEDLSRRSRGQRIDVDMTPVVDRIDGIEEAIGDDLSEILTRVYELLEHVSIESTDGSSRSRWPWNRMTKTEEFDARDRARERAERWRNRNRLNGG